MGNNGRAYAKVQFATNNSAEKIIALVNRREGLCYGSSFLNARESETYIVEPRSYLHEMSDITLCFGCQTSNERFSTLWSAQNVSIKFGSGLKKILFFLSYREVEYKLQLSHENFWQIVLYTTGGRNDKFLVIQLFAAPRIFKRTPGSMYSYFKEFPNDRWVRTTDFSQNLIGQSSGFCLTIPAGVTLPDFRSNLVHCLEVQSPLILEQGSPFSSNLDLVPIMYPPQGVVLPFKLLFRICALVQHGCLPGPLLNADFFHLVDPQWRDINCIEYALAKMFSLHECCYDPVQWLTQEYEKFKYSPVSTFINLENGLVYVRRALVTPIRVYFCGPEVNKSNRVLRHYIDDIDNFLRVSFVDEDWDKIQPADLSSRASGKTAIYDRMLGILSNGIVIGDKRFEFLAFSSSQLREGSIWMFASRDGLTAADIRAWMGDFKKIKNVAKYAARLGQSFGSSTETLSIPRDEIEITFASE
ncbi:unnamed protein product [Cuscuta campestris]|uniref:RNA-dependent RNA polymerase n=1 Tax=Cuscuta campestris TaxID=132261 RepID=A0A484ND19_9ASTE|nr:unnamed protein product [Cuscuta campestris]